MADLDKKIQKPQTDLVQAVLEAHEKRNNERVDILVNNAIKQLKISRFKPDLTTCLSLAYLARIQPKLFHQSAPIKDMLKSLLRRDQGPANIKGKNDIVLPVLAANILLTTCDAPETRTLILHKIEQWLAANSKVSDLVQQLLATLCIKCQSNDKQTISTLIDLRQHWLQYLDDNHSFYGSVPVELSASLRSLIKNEANCEHLLGYLRFLVKHDTIDGLSLEVSKFVTERPTSLKNMLQEENHGVELNKMILEVFNNLFTTLKESSQQPPAVDIVEQEEKMIVDEQKPPTVDSKPPLPSGIKIKVEPNLPQPVKSEVKEETKSHQLPNAQDDNSNSNSNGLETKFYKTLYVRMSNQTVAIKRPILEAVLTLFSMVEDELPFNGVYEDFGLKTPYQIPDQLRQKLIHSSNDLLVDLGLNHANPNQLVGLLQTFGLSPATLGKILKRLELIKDAESIKTEIKDSSFFNDLVGFYKELGVPGATNFHRRLCEQSSN